MLQTILLIFFISFSLIKKATAHVDANTANTYIYLLVPSFVPTPTKTIGFRSVILNFEQSNKVEFEVPLAMFTNEVIGRVQLKFSVDEKEFKGDQCIVLKSGSSNCETQVNDLNKIGKIVDFQKFVYDRNANSITDDEDIIFRTFVFSTKKINYTCANSDGSDSKKFTVYAGSNNSNTFITDNVYTAEKPENSSLGALTFDPANKKYHSLKMKINGIGTITADGLIFEEDQYQLMFSGKKEFQVSHVRGLECNRNFMSNLNDCRYWMARIKIKTCTKD